MRLYLSSYRWGNKPEALFAMLGSNKHTAIVTNAADYYPEDGIVERFQYDQEYLKERGITSERLDLRKYFDDNAALRRDLRKFGLIWVRGGNTFVLRRAFAQSGFDMLLPELLEQDTVVYGGYSAGACILGPTLRGLDLIDDTRTIPDGYKPEILWEGLGIVPYAIAPHYKSDHPESEMVDNTVAYFAEHRIPYKTLHDGEAILIDGGQHAVVG